MPVVLLYCPFRHNSCLQRCLRRCLQALAILARIDSCLSLFTVNENIINEQKSWLLIEIDIFCTCKLLQIEESLTFLPERTLKLVFFICLSRLLLILKKFQQIISNNVKVTNICRLHACSIIRWVLFFGFMLF